MRQINVFLEEKLLAICIITVSYTHLDVYKRQALDEIKSLCFYMDCYRAPADYTLLEEGADGDYLMLVLSGSVRVEKLICLLYTSGWILGKDTHTDLPAFSTPTGQITLTGQVWVPSKKIFTLEDKATSANGHAPWQAVWQHMDMAKYRATVPFSVSAVAIRLDSTSEAGGFVRNWQVPAERIATNIGYAYQWFGFALAALLIFIYMSFTKIKPETDVG